MMCVDANQDGKVDFNEFTDRFHNPAKDIGFNVAVLLTNLSEHMPNDPWSVTNCTLYWPTWHTCRQASFSFFVFSIYVF